MKKFLIAICLLCCVLLLPSCNKQCEYEQKISQLRQDVLIGETEDVKIICYPEQREALYEADGKCAPPENTVIFKLYFKNPDMGSEACSVSFSIGGKDYTGSFEYSPLSTNLHCAIKTDALPSDCISVTVEGEKLNQTVEIRSAKNQGTISFCEALESLKSSDQSGASLLEGESTEIRIRLIDNGGKDYWYVGLISPEKEISFLLDGETGEIVAKKDDL